jgi:hypothetical protein
MLEAVERLVEKCNTVNQKHVIFNQPGVQFSSNFGSKLIDYA